jgi:hypothetical protein
MRRLAVALSTLALMIGGTMIVSCGGDSTTDPTEDTFTPPGDTTSPGDTPVSDTPDPDDTVTCEPLCLDGWQCGPDGCGGSCGTCAVGTTCNQAKHKCEAEGPPPAELAEFGEQCGRKGDCQNAFYNETKGEWEANPQWPACKHAQCATGVCMEPACTKPCTMTKDTLDSAGNPGADGIDDPDAPFNDCAGAEDGIMGSAYTCVNANALDNPQPNTICRPGTTFKECFVSADCPGEETCQLNYIAGEYTLRCMTAPKGAQPIGSECNLNPEDGDIMLCEADCYGIGCVGFCQTDSDCATNENGCGADNWCIDDSDTACTVDTDCSAWECVLQKNLSGDPLAPIEFDTCYARVCDLNKDCNDGDYFCRPYINGEYNDNLAWENRCVAKPANSVGLGEECEDDPDDNIPKPDCGTGWCQSGTCSAVCEQDGHCVAGGADMLCGWTEYSFDYEPKDNVVDNYLPIGLCQKWPGTNNSCTSSTDCAANPGVEACKFIETKDTASGSFDGTGLCTTVEANMGDIGDPCGGNSGISCKAGFCFGTNGEQPGWCSGLCGKTADCPQGATLGTFTGAYNLACIPYRVGVAGTMDATDDDIYVSICFPGAVYLGGFIPGNGLMQITQVPNAETNTGSSLADCSADYACTDTKETCVVFHTAQGSTGPTHVDYLCVNNKLNMPETAAPNSPSVVVNPSASLGDACTVDAQISTDTTCDTLYCLPDVGDAGYCSGLCKTDADCSALGASGTCDDVIVVDRQDDSQDVTVKACRKAESCVSCSNQTDCASGYSCINVGGPGLLAEYACAPSCSVDTDCAGTDGGSTCTESMDNKGKGEGVNACAPAGGC